MPTATNPEDFGREVEAFIADVVSSGIGVRDIYNHTIEDAIKNDTRDWEVTLAKIIENPGKYGYSSSLSALSISRFRGNGRRADIVEAASRLLSFQVDRVVSSVRDKTSNGENADFFVLVSIRSLVFEVLNLKSRRLLGEVLTLVVSDESDEINLLDEGALLGVA
ncbi:MAG: hypothetical protein EOP06_24665, partial [Proteobacteria bacterium]